MPSTNILLNRADTANMRVLMHLRASVPQNPNQTLVFICMCFNNILKFLISYEYNKEEDDDESNLDYAGAWVASADYEARAQHQLFAPWLIMRSLVIKMMMMITTMIKPLIGTCVLQDYTQIRSF